MFVHEELSDSCETDLARTLKAPPESTSIAGFWKLNADDQVSSPISSCADKDPLVEMHQCAANLQPWKAS